LEREEGEQACFKKKKKKNIVPTYEINFFEVAVGYVNDRLR